MRQCLCCSVRLLTWVGWAVSTTSVCCMPEPKNNLSRCVPLVHGNSPVELSLSCFIYWADKSLRHGPHTLRDVLQSRCQHVRCIVLEQWKLELICMSSNTGDVLTCLHTASYSSSGVMPCAMRCPKTSLKVFVATPSILLVLTLHHATVCELHSFRRAIYL